MTMLSFRQVESMLRKSPTNIVVARLLSFLIVWIMNTINKGLFLLKSYAALHYNFE